LNRYLRDWLGSETRISGEVVRTPAGLAVTARAGANAGTTFQGPDADLDRLMQKAAEAVYARTQPYRRAVYLASIGHTDEAIAAYQQLARSGAPEDRAWAYTGWSELLLLRGQAPQALDAARQALAIDPELTPAKIAQSSAFSSLGRDEEVIKLAGRIADDVNAGHGKGVAVGEAAETASSAAGVAAQTRADYQSAMRLVTQKQGTVEGAINTVYPAIAASALVADHDVTRAWRVPGVTPNNDFLRLRALVILDDWAAAAAVSDKLRALYGGAIPPPVPSNTKVMATAYARAGRLTDAKALVSATALDCYDCLISRGNVAAAEHDWTATDRWYAEAARQGPSIPLAQTAWGQSLLDRGDVDGAIAKFRAAHRITPHYADPLELWGEALTRKGDYAGAVAKFAEADKYAPRWGRNHFRWGEALMFEGRHAEARRQYEAANGLDLSKPDRAALNVLLTRTASGPLHG
jgi:tetratricopeptide (TPR) repeat protein